MTKKIFMLMAACLMLTMVACTPTKEKAMNQLEKIVTEASAESTNYTAEDWVKFLSEYQTADSLLNTVELTAEEKQKVGELKGQAAAYVIKGQVAKAKLQLKGAINGVLNEATDAVEGVLDEVEGAAKEAEGAVKGFLDGLKDDKEKK